MPRDESKRDAAYDALQIQDELIVFRGAEHPTREQCRVARSNLNRLRRLLQDVDPAFVEQDVYAALQSLCAEVREKLQVTTRSSS